MFIYVVSSSAVGILTAFKEYDDAVEYIINSLEWYEREDVEKIREELERYMEYGSYRIDEIVLKG